MKLEQLTIRDSSRSLLKETFEGPAKSGSFFTNTEPDTGLLGTIERINAREASMILPSSEASIAAHVHHTLYFLQVSAAHILKEDRHVDWGISWKIHEVDEATWQAFKSQLREEYENYLSLLDHIDFSGEQVEQVMASLAHSAYHLGALRQLVNQL
ncbi:MULTISPECIES: hypothetical protein [Alteribacter]|uniref:DinB family protein n=1 Tax=Alteribacter keqinensis TaxID=2483800 RepID=A0A3M7TLT6_9BACI|nr:MULTISPECIES: hypothetical protein [Alteribacter]MBM7096766.1 hypothetical protein [Alteribacter salitolerans]RNA66304.1 hypothetical protein EBO34_19490 [Alteribacter keqinensis]